jgi:phosphate transport system ATP-binding protein
MKNEVIKVKDFNLYYGTLHALKDLSIVVERNSITAFIGPSGCGKSSFLRAFNRMNDLIPEAKNNGLIFFKEENISEKNYDVIELRKKVGMVFQKANPFAKSIYDNITYGPKIHGERRKSVLTDIVERTLTEVGLFKEVKDRMNTPALSISGGQHQRLCIARALATSPEVLLMDEPTSALDPGATLKIEKLMKELKEKYTVIVVTHNMQQAKRISDKTAFFLLGEIIEFGDTKKIFEAPDDERTLDYISGRFG